MAQNNKAGYAPRCCPRDPNFVNHTRPNRELTVSDIAKMLAHKPSIIKKALADKS